MIWLTMPNAGRDQHIDLRMAEEQNRYWNSTGSPPPEGSKKVVPKVAIGQHHGDGAREHR